MPRGSIQRDPCTAIGENQNVRLAATFASNWKFTKEIIRCGADLPRTAASSSFCRRDEPACESLFCDLDIFLSNRADQFCPIVS